MKFPFSQVKVLSFAFFAMLFPISTVQCVPPAQVPSEYYSQFTLDGRIPVAFWYFNDSYPPSQPLVYTKEVIAYHIEQAKRHVWAGYGITDQYLYQALEKYISFIQGKDVANIGSTWPWYDSVILRYEGKLVTIDYNKIISQDPRMKTMTIAEYDASDTPQLFDAIVSISSIEHDGLGRYGDPINPIGDLKAMEQHKKMLKKGGLLFLAVPIGRDQLVWNAHRIYGRIRLPMLLEGWDMIDSFGFSDNCLDQGDYTQPVLVLTPR